jgi:urease accessory protein
MLDWITSGRKSLGEDWEFSRYYSSNQFWIGGSRIAKDDTLLEDSNNLQISRTLRDRLAPYSCYATLVLIGPLVCNIVDELQNEYQSLSVFAQSSPQKLLWSMSPLIDNGKRSDAWIIRIAAIDSEAAKHWLKDALHGLRSIVGQDVYLRTFA